MKITWYGHACFGVESEGYRIVLDPYEGVKGYQPLHLTANEVLCSHGHYDHCCRAAVKVTGAKSPFRVASVATWHDDREGALRGENTVHILRAEGLTAVHLGDLGHQLNREQTAALRGCDVLMIPVGGTYTVDPAGARAVTEALRPRIVVPMHYRRGSLGFDNIAPLEKFLALFPAEEIHELDGSSFTVTPELSGVVVPAYRP
jgi:L-ascorbate metabolism protein UlaG (beta-lactamase superfamily)